MHELLVRLETARDRLNNALEAESPGALIHQALTLVRQVILELKVMEIDQLRQEIATGARHLPLSLTKSGMPRKPRSDAGKKRPSYKRRRKPADKKNRS